MKIKIYSIALLFFVALAGSILSAKAESIENETNFAQSDDRCKVADPTGTALNVRSTPNGKRIVKKLKNGTTVYVVTETGDAQDRAWAKITLSNKANAPVIGWVLREYLDCP